jgi:hypothetical protein
MIHSADYRQPTVNSSIADLPFCRDPLQALLDDVLLKQRILSDQVLESLAKGVWRPAPGSRYCLYWLADDCV